MKHFIFLSFLIVFGLSCESKTEDPDPALFGYEYYPLEIGNAWVYAVDSTVIFGGGNDILTYSSFVRDEITELIEEEGDLKSYRLERSFSMNQDGPWTLTDVWKIGRDDERAYRSEENLDFIKLVFPNPEGVSWDGNALFDHERIVQVGPDLMQLYLNWEYEVTSRSLSKTVGNQMLSEVLEVVHIEDDDDFKFRRISKEYYGNGVGLVEREIEFFESKNGKAVGLDWLTNADLGFTVSQKLVSYSIN